MKPTTGYIHLIRRGIHHFGQPGSAKILRATPGLAEIRLEPAVRFSSATSSKNWLRSGQPSQDLRLRGSVTS